MTTILEQTFFLALSQNGRWRLSGRLSKSLPALKAGEIALSLTVKLPETLFKKPSLRASIEVPESAVSAPVIDSAVVDNIREIVQQQLGVDLQIAVVEPTRVEINGNPEP
jgi:hypothetical protein